MSDESLLKNIPFARFLGMEFSLQNESLIAHLPYRQDLIGNPMIPAIHGGVISAFMELTSVAQLTHTQNLQHLPKPINVSVQYLRPAKAADTFATAKINRIGRTIASIEVNAWQVTGGQVIEGQDSTKTLIATLQAHFLLTN